MALATNAINVKGVDLATEVNGKVALSGARGQLAGYETTATVASLTVSESTPDSVVYNSTAAITVNNGSAGTSWIKVVMCQQAPISVALGTNWAWVGGSAPSLSVNGTLVSAWNGVRGVANFLSVTA